MDITTDITTEVGYYDTPHTYISKENVFYIVNGIVIDKQGIQSIQRKHIIKEFYNKHNIKN